MRISFAALSLAAAVVATPARSHADIQKSGPEEWPGRNMIGIHIGGQAGLTNFGYGAGAPGGFRLELSYDYRITDMVWFDAGANFVFSTGCGVGPCPYYSLAGNTAEPAAGIRLNFRTAIPLVAFAKFDAVLVGIWGRYCTDNGFALAGRVAGGANYYLLRNLGVGLQMGFTAGPAWLGGASAADCGIAAPTTAGHSEFYAAIDFSAGVEFAF